VDRSQRQSKCSSARRHAAKVVAVVVALFVVAVCVSTALADVGPLSSIITTSESTPPSAPADAPTDGSANASTSADASATDGTGAPSFFTDTTSTSTGSSDPSSSGGTPGVTSLIVKLAPGLTTDQQSAVIARDGGSETRTIAPLRLHVVEVDDADADATLQNYLGDAQVVSAELDKTRDVTAPPDDTSYADQWALPRIGWDSVYPNDVAGSATVAVLDTGVDATHEDLQGQLVAGASMLPDSVAGTDANGHGTEMAGIVAAATNNGTGIAGVGYAGVKVMPVTVLGPDGTGQDSDVIAGVVYAVQHGADVILMSFSNPGFSQSLQDAIDYAWDNDVVVVAATGNDASSAPSFPAGDRGVIGVSNTDEYDNLNALSNYGEDTFLAAPGTHVLTTSDGGGYASITGTSASAAMVAGAAALLRARSAAGLSNGVIVSRLAESADAAGTTAQTGNGRLNLARAATDTSTTSVEPAGAAPVGGGGPFIGPYTISAGSLSNATVDGGPSTDTTSSATIAVSMTVTSSNANANNRVFAIGWRIATSPGAFTCVDIADVSNQTVTRTFNITAPATNGIYNAYFQGFDNNTCTSNANNTNLFTLTNGVVVGVPTCGGNLICIDGDLGDWKALPTAPSYADFPTDAGGGSGDITAIRVTSANSNLYVRWDETLTSNRSQVASDGFSVTIDANRDGTPDHRAWVMFNSSGVATTQVQDIAANTFTAVGAAQQTCNFVACTNGGAASIEASFPLAAFNPTGALIGLQTETRASTSTNSSTKDCVPGQGAGVCNGFFDLDTDTGGTTVDAGHATTTTIACPETVRNLNQSTSTCTVTVHDTGVDTNNAPVTAAHPTGTVNFFVSGGTGTFSPAACTLTPAAPAADSTCNVTYTPTTLGTGTHTLKASYAGDTAPIQFAGSNGTDTVAINSAPTADAQTVSVTQDVAKTITLTGSDVDGNTLTFSIVSGPSHGSLGGIGAVTCTGTAPKNCSANVTYTPNSGYTGSDSFTFKTNDGMADSSAATVTINVVANAATTTNASSTSATYGDSSVLLSATVTSASTVNSGTVTFTLKSGATTIGSATTGNVVSGFASVNYATPAGTAAGSYTIFADYSGATGLASSSDHTATLTINKATLTVTADNKTRQFGDANPIFTASYSGFKNGETLATSGVTGSPSLATTATPSSPVAGSPYTITAALGTLTAGNYSLTFLNGQLTVSKATLTVTADNKSREYGDANPTFTASYAGFKNGETLATSGVTGSPSLTTTATAASSVAGSAYTITAALGSLASGNYSFTFANGQLTVTKATLTVTGDDKSRQYGDANPALTASYSGFKNGENLATSGVTGSPSLTTTATAASPVGSTTITAALGTLAAGNYSFALVNGTLTVTKALLTVTADDKSREYGDPNPSFTASYSGFKNGETLAASGVTGSPSLTTAATAASPVGSYTITAALDSLASGNYSFSFVSGQLTVTKATLTVTADDKSREYGDPNPTLTPSYSGFKNSETLATSGLTGSPSLTTTATAASSVAGSPYTITAAVGSLASGNYSFSFVNGQLTVTKATLSVTADDKTREYGDTNPVFTAGYSGFKNGETLATSDVTGAASLTTTATAASPVGSYTITAAVGTLASGNYSFSFHNGTLTVGKTTLTVTADDKSREYGDANPTFTASYTGFKNGETLATSDVTGSPSLTTAATATSSVAGSPYAITAALGSLASGNYSFSFVSGQLAVTKATLTVSADDKSRVYGDANPVFTASYSGFKNGEVLGTSGVTGAPSLTTLAHPTSSVAGSPYAITAALGTLAAGNYSFNFVDGALTVSKATLTVTADDKSREYGDPNPSFTASYSGFKNGETLATSDVLGSPSLSTAATAGSPVGSYTITAALGTLSSGNYSFSFVSGQLTVTKATLSVTADDKSRVYGDANPSFTASYSGFKNGETLATSDVTGSPSLTTTATGTSNVAGSPYTITAALGTLASGNYSFSFVSGQLAVTKATLTVSADDKSRVYGDANPVFTASYSGFKNGETLATSGVTGSPSLTTSADPSSSVAGSPYTITAALGTLAAGNYSFSFVNGQLTVTKATLTVTADNKTRVYGDANPAFTGNVFGIKNGDNITATYASTATPSSAVGSYAIVPTLVDPDNKLPNYTVSSTNGTLTITKATLTVTADDKTREYGDPNPSFSASYSGFKNGENLASSGVTGSPSLTTGATPTSSVAGSPYTITAALGTLASGNYSFAFVNGHLAVTKATLTVTADNKTRVYGDPNPAFTASYSGFKNGETLATSGVTGSPSLTTTALPSSPVNGNPYTISAAMGTLAAGNYSFSFVDGTLTITKAKLTVTADNKSREYGDPNPSLTASFSGFKNGETFATSDVLGSPSLSTAATATSAVGPYPISAAVGSLSSGNYDFYFVDGTLTVTKATLTVTADDKSRVYGDANPVFTASYSGFKNGETLATSGVTGSPSLSTAAVATSSVAGGPYAITAALGTLASGNYSFAFVNGHLAVTKATLTVTADNKTRVYGDPNPAFTASYSGFKNGETLATSGVTGSPSLTTTATATSPVAPAYAISAALGTLAAGNYGFTFLDGSLAITQANLTVTADNKSRVYGEANPSFTASYSGFKNGETLATSGVTGSPSLTTSATAASAVGSYTIVAAGGSLASVNYYFTPVNGTLTVTKATLAVTADNKSRVYGDANPVFTASYSGFKNGETLASSGVTGSPSLTTAATATSSVAGGPYTITAVLGTLASGNYSFSLVNGQLTVTKATLTVTADNKSRVYGDPTPTFTASYSGFKNGETLATSGVTGSPSLTTSATPTSGVAGSPYTITAALGTLAAGNYTFTFTNGQLTVTKSVLTVTADNASKQYGDPNPTFTASYSGFKNGETLATSGVSGNPSLITTATSASIVGTYTITAAVGTLTAGNYSFAFVNGTLSITPKEAPVAYIGQTAFYSSGSSSTTAQVTLSASVQDTTGSGGTLANATVTFTDLLTGKVLASGVKVTPVTGSSIPTGTANTVVTLSTGNYGAQQYLIEVSLGGMYKNTQQTGAAPGTDPYNAAHPVVAVMIPPTQYSMQGSASITKLASAAGTYGDAATSSYVVGLKYNNKGTNPQGQIQLVLERADGTYYVKSNSITSVAFAGSTIPANDMTVYTKASIYRVGAGGALTSIDGGVTLRMDAHEGCTTSPNCSSSNGDTIGFTVLSGKDSSLYYSNNWVYDTQILGWRTVLQSVSGPAGSAVIIN
jgi:MBG domain-containing protein/Big-like domain-containing protein